MNPSNYLHVMSQSCPNCLFGANRLLSEVEANQLIQSCLKDDRYFICHRSTFCSSPPQHLQQCPPFDEENIGEVNTEGEIHENDEKCGETDFIDGEEDWLEAEQNERSTVPVCCHEFFNRYKHDVLLI